ncbi:hypothetical protein IID21_04465 [Patescibacteria group bacterium]|nr:hypothetical protein [Patescibacteria group bacterium]
MATKKKIYSTQEHLDIDDVRDNLATMKGGETVAIVQTNSVNFDLLSENEQDAMIFGYASFLNSLSFPVQVLIRSKRMDVSNYLQSLALVRKKARNAKLVDQIDKYAFFIKDLVEKNQVLNKRFYIIIPYLAISLTQLKNAGLGIFGKKAPKTDKWLTLEKAKENLSPKIDHVIKQLSRIGILARQLNTEELVELFYDIYNPEVGRNEKASLSPKEYTTPIVEPAVSPVMEQDQSSESQGGGGGH